MQNPIPRQLCFLRTARVLAALTISAAAHAADITYETRALTGTDGPLGPGLGAGLNFTALTPPMLNGAGQTAFSGTLNGPVANRAGIWSEGGGSGPALVARSGNPAPDTEVGVNFSSFGSLVLNSAGQTAFSGVLTGPGVAGGVNNAGIWSLGGGSGLALIARIGSPAPGTDPGVNFNGLGEPLLNGTGQTAFQGSLTGPGVAVVNNSGIWSQGGGSVLALVARRGNQAPGTAAGVNFGAFGSLMFNGAGQTAFVVGLAGAGVTSANDRGIWSGGGGSNLALIARKNGQTPGTDPSVNFSNFNPPVLNGAGQTAFLGVLTGVGVTGANDFGIWSEGGGSGLALVARKGSQAPGTDPGVNFSSLSNPVLNRAGQTAFEGFISGPGVTTANERGIWSEGGGSGLALVAREGNQAPGTDEGVNFSSFSSNTRVLNGAGQTAFIAFLTGPGVTSANDTGIWATGLEGQLHLIVRKGDLYDVSNDPLNPDPRTISSLGYLIGSGGLSSGGEDGRPTVFNDAGQLAFFLNFTGGSSGIFVATIGGSTTTPLTVTITPATAPATGHDLAWDSQPGKVYDLVTSTDLATPTTEWPVHASYADIPATGATTTLTAVPVDGPQRFFAVIEKDAPLVSSDD